MDEPRESRLAAILARALMRVRKRGSRAGGQDAKGDAPSSTSACLAADNQATAFRAAGQQGEPQ